MPIDKGVCLCKRLSADRIDEPEYGYGGWTGNDIFAGIMVTCLDCGHEERFDIWDLESLAIGAYEKV